jgi:hypothetical protein
LATTAVHDRLPRNPGESVPLVKHSIKQVNMKKKTEPTTKTKPKPKLTNAERHKRFVDMAREVGADESPEAFDRAFELVIPLRLTSQKR